MHTTEFKIAGQKFLALSEEVDTDFGPENHVIITAATGETMARYQEPANTQTIIDQFEEDFVSGAIRERD